MGLQVSPTTFNAAIPDNRTGQESRSAGHRATPNMTADENTPGRLTHELRRYEMTGSDR
jgi:hypothetical protein